MRTMAFLIVAALMMATGCATTLQKTSVDFVDNPATKKQAKEGVTIENLPLKEFPPSFYGTLQACVPGTQNLDPGIFSPPMDKVAIASAGQAWYKLAITNDSDHVLRLSKTVIKLKDPHGEMHDQIMNGEIFTDLEQSRPCPTTMQLLSVISALKMLSPNSELLPKTTEDFWLVFKTETLAVPGTWTLSIFDVPVKVDQAGNPVKTTRFDFDQRAEVKIETIRQSADGTETILSSQTRK